MNVFNNSLEGFNNFLLSNVDYEMILVIKSSLKSEKKRISQKIGKLKSLTRELRKELEEQGEDYEVKNELNKDYERQILYFHYLSDRIEFSITSIDEVLNSRI